jgi:hypothetical protein
MRKILGIVLAVAMLTVGCGAGLASILANIVSGVVDAITIVDQVNDFVDTYFKSNPNPDLQKKIGTVISKCRTSINNLVNRAARGSQDLQNKEVLAATVEFKAAFDELMDLVGPLGCQVDGGKYKGAPSTFTVKKPLLLLDK